MKVIEKSHFFDSVKHSTKYCATLKIFYKTIASLEYRQQFIFFHSSFPIWFCPPCVNILVDNFKNAWKMQKIFSIYNPHPVSVDRHPRDEQKSRMKLFMWHIMGIWFVCFARFMKIVEYLRKEEVEETSTKKNYLKSTRKEKIGEDQLELITLMILLLLVIVISCSPTCGLTTAVVCPLSFPPPCNASKLKTVNQIWSERIVNERVVYFETSFFISLFL